MGKDGRDEGQDGRRRRVAIGVVPRSADSPPSDITVTIKTTVRFKTIGALRSFF